MYFQFRYNIYCKFIFGPKALCGRSRNRLMMLVACQWLHWPAGNLLGLFTSGLKPDPETGIERAAFDPMVTPKGLTRLAELLQEAA